MIDLVYFPVLPFKIEGDESRLLDSGKQRSSHRMSNYLQVPQP